VSGFELTKEITVADLEAALRDARASVRDAERRVAWARKAARLGWRPPRRGLLYWLRRLVRR